MEIRQGKYCRTWNRYYNLTVRYNQLINQPTYKTKNNLVFTSNPNFIGRIGVERLLFQKCHTSKLQNTFQISCFPKGKCWTGYFRCWLGLFLSGKIYRKKVDILKEWLKNTFHNFVRNRLIKCDYRHPPWMTDSI